MECQFSFIAVVSIPALEGYLFCMPNLLDISGNFVKENNVISFPSGKSLSVEIDNSRAVRIFNRENVFYLLHYNMCGNETLKAQLPSSKKRQSFLGTPKFNASVKRTPTYVHT